MVFRVINWAYNTDCVLQTHPLCVIEKSSWPLLEKAALLYVPVENVLLFAAILVRWLSAEKFKIGVQA